MGLYSDFHAYYRKVLYNSPMWENMAAVTEGSPWHREANVRIHTEMVVKEYILRTPGEWTTSDMRGAIACAFHDVGKPKAKVTKYNAQRGQYFAFHGHEQVSARLWEDYAVREWSTLEQWFEWDDIYKIGWMIEYHVPWALKDHNKRIMLAKTANYVDSNVFTRVLLADQYGRESDDQEAKLTVVRDWVDEFRKLCEEVK